MKTRLMLYLLGDKARLVTLVVVTAALGYALGERFTGLNPGTLLETLIGVTLCASGASVLNQVIERHSDALMKRTMSRPLPTGRVSTWEAGLIGSLTVLGSVAYLALTTNALTALLSAVTALLYVAIYTPLKKVTWLNTIIGAIPGALPALGGYTAATGQIGAPGMLLFLIVFLWQHPHFYAIAWMYREDYARAGMKMLPVVYPEGRQTVHQVLVFTILLFVVSLYPLSVGWVAPVSWYVAAASVGAVVLGYPAVRFARERSIASARMLLRGSLLYLPLLLTVLALDVKGS